MRRTIAFIAAACIALTLAACSKSDKTDDAVSLVLNGTYVVTDEVVSAISIGGQEIRELTFEGNSLTYTVDGDANATAAYEIKGGKLTFGGHSMSFDKNGGTIIINGVVFGKKPKNAETADNSAAVDTPKPAEDSADLPVVGNTPGNLVNFGFIAQDGEWLYYSNFEDNFSLYRERLDGSGKTKLNNELSWSINVVGDWLYLAEANIDDFTSTRLCKIKTDGTAKSSLAAGISMEEESSVAVIGDWVYYTSIADDSLHKVRTDGTEDMFPKFPSKIISTDLVTDKVWQVRDLFDKRA